MRIKYDLSSRKSQGFSIVELLIAGTLGLLLLGGVIQLFFGSNQNFKLQTELSGIQEDGRFALTFLENEIQMASWTEDFLEVQPAIDFTNSADGVTDTITVTRKMSVASGNNIDCNGATVASGVVQNRFYVENNQLMCLGNGGGAAQPFIGNVEGFQVTYGVETDAFCPDGAVNQFMNKETLLAKSFNAVYQQRVLSVRVGLVLRSENEVLPEDKEETFKLLDVDYKSAKDRFARRLFTQTIYMPNSAFAFTSSPDAIISCMQSKI
ncbi:PilW family protein [Aliikangiella sp. IMCC44653]